jgi:hypothetical protein
MGGHQPRRRRDRLDPSSPDNRPRIGCRGVCRNGSRDCSWRVDRYEVLPLTGQSAVARRCPSRADRAWSGARGRMGSSTPRCQPAGCQSVRHSRVSGRKSVEDQRRCGGKDAVDRPRLAARRRAGHCVLCERAGSARLDACGFRCMRRRTQVSCPGGHLLVARRKGSDPRRAGSGAVACLGRPARYRRRRRAEPVDSAGAVSGLPPLTSRRPLPSARCS